MSLLLPFLLAFLPVLPLLAGLLARGRSPGLAGRLATSAAALSAVLAATCATALALGAAPAGFTARWAPFGTDAAFAIALRLDAISAVMVVLVAFLGTVVLRFSRSYLAGDPAQSRFFSWMSLTLASVLTLVLSGHLLLLLAAWISTSLSLHRLLLHYPERAGAVFSARKKFVVSRLGDLCLLTAALVLHRVHGTWDIEQLFVSVAAGQTASLPLVGFLLAACAALKSAQFPFHSWLPDTMETPTPVSAFMHAGIINAGGFLLIRFSPLLVHAPGPLNLLAILGALTAAFGAVVMLAQPGVKRALAYSTIAQMGFMILQCGLGAWPLALLHIVAHSLYKAHAFLTAGSTIGAVPRAAIPLRTPALALGLLGGGLLVAGVATALHAIAPEAPLHLGVFGVVLAFALAYGLARAASAGGGPGVFLRATALALLVCVAGLALHLGAHALFPGLPATTPPPTLLAFVAAIFAALFLFQSLLWRANRHALGRRLYIHALNGFYLGTLANRLLGRLWPRHATS
jgi:NAD(P)H-quinone oxidoreductase subunit 5